MRNRWFSAVLLLAGCGETHSLTVVSGVFSESGERAAVMVQHIESTRLCVTFEGCPVDSSSSEYTIAVGAVVGNRFDEEETLYLGTGTPPSELYYMHAAGYLLLEWNGITGGDHARVVDANGERRLSRRAAVGSFTETIPSRDGSVVAEVERGAADYLVHFVDPRDDSTVDTVAFPSGSDMLWTSDGRFGIARLPEDRPVSSGPWPAFFARPNGPAFSDVVDDCYIASTSSGPRTEDGRTLPNGIAPLPVTVRTATEPAKCLAGGMPAE